MGFQFVFAEIDAIYSFLDYVIRKTLDSSNSKAFVSANSDTDG